MGWDFELGGEIMKKTMILIIIILCALLFAEIETIKRDRAILREGPASYYPIKSELQKGTEFFIKQELAGWLEVELNDTDGFLSKKVITARKEKTDLFGQMNFDGASLKLSKHGMSAGVKGFAENFSKKFSGDPTFLGRMYSYEFDYKAYKKFRKATYKRFNIKKNRKKIHLPDYSGNDFFNMSEEGIGIGIASRIASFGIYENPAVNTYVNFVGNIVAESTDVYDIQFRFFILNSEKVNAYACPGGIIFITKGLLKQIQTEAELATVLAHEMAHVARKHGMKEMEQRKHHINADDVFAEMDAEFAEFGVETEEDKSIEEELDELAFDIYETIVSGRLKQYEDDADYLGILYAARAGYDSKQLINLLNRLQYFKKGSTNEHYNQDDIQKRIDKIKMLKLPKFPKNLFDKKQRCEESLYYVD